MKRRVEPRAKGGKAGAGVEAAKPLLRGLARPVTPAMRARLRAQLQQLVAWQSTFRGWPKTDVRGPNATAFVSVYSAGRLRGCFGVDDGAIPERVARAFLRAANDARFGGLAAEDGDGVTAILSYAHSIAPLEPTGVAAVLEVGRHGLLYVRDDGRAAILLPQVARDQHLGPRGLLEALARKAETTAIAAGRLFMFETHDVSSREEARTGGARVRAGEPVARGASFLERLVGSDGHVDFAVDPRTGARQRTGQMHHGRAALVVSALEGCGRRTAAARARERLARDVEQALAARPPEGWPDDACVAAGSIALAVLAGVDAEKDLRRFVHDTSFEASAWHAAQVVVALGAKAPRALYDGCVVDLEARPWAPWTALAAQKRGDADVANRCATELARSVRRGPHDGGVGFRDVPEIALTAIVIEALAASRDAASRAAVERARAFLLAWQNRPGVVSGPIDPRYGAGGFPLTPVDDGLRGDVTAHALLALLAARGR